MYSKKVLPLFLMTAVMIFFQMFYSLGIPVAIMEIFIIIVAFLYLQGRKIVVGNIFYLLICLVLIDKGNDIIYDFSLNNVGPIIYTIFVVLVFNNIGESVDDFVKIFKFLLIVSVVLSLVVATIYSPAPLKSLDRSVSVMLMFFSMLNLYYGKYKWPIFFIAAFVCIFVLEARTMIISYGIFIMGYFVFRKKERLKLKKTILVIELFFSFYIIYLGIQDEYILGSIKEEVIHFSGRGYIWGVALAKFWGGSWWEIIFGLPSNPDNLRRMFDWNMFEYTSLNESIGSLLISGHFHNTFIYYIYNTGILGTILLLITFYLSLKAVKFSQENYNIFNALFIVALFNGRSLTGIYTISTLFMFILLIKLPDSTIKWKYNNYSPLKRTNMYTT